MLDPLLRRVIDPPLARLGRRLAAAGVGADALTVAGFVCGLAAAAALAVRADLLALALILANRLLDGLDGAVARVRGPSDFGGYLDIVCDFVVYAVFVLGFAVGRPEHALWAAALIASFFCSGGSFLAFAIIAAKRGLETSGRGRKSFFHAGGLAEGSETVAVFVAICLFPDAFPWIAGVFAAACVITAVGRTVEARTAFRSGPAIPGD